MMTSSIVLAGGKGSRLGREKASLKIGGKTLIERVISCLAPLSTEIIVVTGQGEAIPFESPLVKTIGDLYPGKGALGGIYSGLAVSTSSHNLVVACDMPFLNAGLLRYMIELSPPFDVVIPRVEENVEPLHAVYSKACLPSIEGMLKEENLKIADILPLVKVRCLSEDEINRFDSQHLSFFNVNTPADLKRAEALKNT